MLNNSSTRSIRRLGLLEREIAMNGGFLWVLLFVGNVGLLLLWVNYIVKVLIGRCPHCGR